MASLHAELQSVNTHDTSVPPPRVATGHHRSIVPFASVATTHTASVVPSPAVITPGMREPMSSVNESDSGATWLTPS